MTLRVLKCPNCGGTVQMDESMKKGFCMYCGNPVINEPTLSDKVFIDNSQNISSLNVLAQAALDSKRYDEAEEYARKALEFAADNRDAWTIRCQAVLLTANLQSDGYMRQFHSFIDLFEASQRSIHDPEYKSKILDTLKDYNGKIRAAIEPDISMISTRNIIGLYEYYHSDVSFVKDVPYFAEQSESMLDTLGNALVAQMNRRLVQFNRCSSRRGILNSSGMTAFQAATRDLTDSYAVFRIYLQIADPERILEPARSLSVKMQSGLPSESATANALKPFIGSNDPANGPATECYNNLNQNINRIQQTVNQIRGKRNHLYWRDHPAEYAEAQRRLNTAIDRRKHLGLLDRDGKKAADDEIARCQWVLDVQHGLPAPNKPAR